MPPGGAFDQESFALANALLGNEPGALALELGLAAISFEALSNNMISVVGAPVEISIDGERAACQASFPVRKGQTLQISVPHVGARTYVAVRGGWSGEPLKGQVLQADEFLLKAPKILEESPGSVECNSVGVVGAESPIIAFVSHQTDRAGIRLHGERITPGEERLSEPACVGAVQVTNEGSLIVLGPHGPTIGGYRKIGAVCSADLDRLAQLRPGYQVVLQPIGLEDAVSMYRGKQKALEAKLVQLRLAALA